jgi:hypothetical protein
MVNLSQEEQKINLSRLFCNSRQGLRPGLKRLTKTAIAGGIKTVLRTWRSTA